MCVWQPTWWNCSMDYAWPRGGLKGNMWQRQCHFFWSGPRGSRRALPVRGCRGSVADEPWHAWGFGAARRLTSLTSCMRGCSL